jgi:hypothetical protein
VIATHVTNALRLVSAMAIFMIRQSDCDALLIAIAGPYANDSAPAEKNNCKTMCYEFE